MKKNETKKTRYSNEFLMMVARGGFEPSTQGL